VNALGDYMTALRLTVSAAETAGSWTSEPEVCLAAGLLGRGLRFEQQKRVSRGNTTAVLDFWVEEILAVEVDGRDFHRAGEDHRRDVELCFEHGFHTLRLPAWLVLRDVEGAVCRIANRLFALGFDGPSVPLTPQEETA
jgi:very-short-patch-repair endonuclease